MLKGGNGPPRLGVKLEESFVANVSATAELSETRRWELYNEPTPLP